MPPLNEPFACSWSGGKDSCLALYLAVRAGATPRGLVTLFTETGQRTRSHGLRRDVIEAQANALSLPLTTRATSWSTYENETVAALRDVRAADITSAVFGDIDIDRHRHWEESVCAQAGLRAYLPIWQWDRRAVLRAFVDFGFSAQIVAVRADALDASFLGRPLTSDVIDAIAAAGADPCGENGEYHTVVTGGPIFRQPIALRAGVHVQRDGCRFVDFELARNAKS